MVYIEEGLGSKGKGFCFQNFFSIVKGAAFQWAGKINTNPNEQHKDECMLPGTGGGTAHNDVCVRGAGRKLSLAGPRLGRWGKEGSVSQMEGRIGRTCLFWQFVSFSCAPPVVQTPADFLTWW